MCNCLNEVITNETEIEIIDNVLKVSYTDGGLEATDYIPINFCPICGESVNQFSLYAKELAMKYKDITNLTTTTKIVSYITTRIQPNDLDMFINNIIILNEDDALNYFYKTPAGVLNALSKLEEGRVNGTVYKMYRKRDLLIQHENCIKFGEVYLIC